MQLGLVSGKMRVRGRVRQEVDSVIIERERERERERAHDNKTWSRLRLRLSVW